MPATQISFASFASSCLISTHTNPSGASRGSELLGVDQCGLSSLAFSAVHSVSAACTTPPTATATIPQNRLGSMYIGGDATLVACTPSVSDAALVVVAHPLAVDGGECARFDGVFSRLRGVSSLDLRSDHDWSVLPDWACGAMDAPRDFPAGSHVALLLGSRVVADAFVCRAGL